MSTTSDKTTEESFQISSELLDTLAQQTRQPCPLCGGSYLLFCYNCFIPVHDRALLPVFRLPIKIEILRHPGEHLSKATGVHAAVLCPEQVQIHNFPEFPDFDPSTTVLLFPSEDATSVSQLSESDLERVERAVFIDSTWLQARSIWTDSRVASWKKVAIQQQKTKFWRYHALGDHCLSTIEAIYHLCREWQLRLNSEYHGEVDNLMIYFMWQYNLIQKRYRENPNLKFTARAKSKQNYIKYEAPKDDEPEDR